MTWLTAIFVFFSSLVCLAQDQSKVEPRTPAAESTPAASPPGQTRDPLAQAMADADGGSLEKAADDVRAYLHAHPDSADAHFALGLILFKQGKASESLAEYTTGSKYHDPGAADLKTVALDYVLLGDYASADHWLTRSLLSNSKDSQTWYYLGRAKYNENRFQEALDAFQQCLNFDPRNVKAEDNLGLTLQALGRSDEARAAYQDAIAWQSRLLKKNAGPFINLGSLLLEHNQAEEALPYLSQAGEISPEDSRVHEQLSKVYVRQNELEKAQGELEKAVTLEPNSASLHFMLGQLYRKRGMMDKAKMELDRGAALKEAPHATTAPREPR